jgi:hypothetical protein
MDKDYDEQAQAYRKDLQKITETVIAGLRDLADKHVV